MGINIIQGKAEDGGFILEGNIHVTKRELEALAAIAEGNDNESAAKKLGISYTTLRNHTYNIMRKLGANNRTEALVKAVENGMIVVSLKKALVKKYADDYLVCKYCERSYTGYETVTIRVEPFVVNHVLMEPPDWEKCPYEDCRADITDTYEWEKVREYHPEYPEIPRKGVKYSTKELWDEENEYNMKIIEEMRRYRERKHH